MLIGLKVIIDQLNIKYVLELQRVTSSAKE